ncbi:formylglycine-generating enzyme family protein [Sorangium sp. So ce131]|uniref:formylglycine-generating enzyme family protein n=1 Tax=Sorangium sp. So ce131 TaxID=3133282 RepID=UPI003F5E8905
MGKMKRAAWLWSAWAFTAGGCAALVGLDDGYYLLDEGNGGTRSCTPGGQEDVRCWENRPQRCDESGQWEDAEPCPKAAPVCRGGTCITPPSCDGLAEACGPEGSSEESCCASVAVPEGSFNRSNDPEYPATVSGFLLDRFEVTVGRFRRFVEAYPESKPVPGSGQHPHIEGSGWNVEWTEMLPANEAELTADVKCSSTYQTWRDTDEGTEHLPMNCLSWYVAFAFCAWDGGRLPTEAEWNYAAAGGEEQRPYPWSNSASDDKVDDSHAVYDCMADRVMPRSCAFSDIQPVGSRSSTGDGRWGHADLAGNMWEWVLDWHAEYPDACNDCANLKGSSYRVFRGGGWGDGESGLLSSRRGSDDQSGSDNPSDRDSFAGVRCARTP